tara:strand:- start:1053 stop:1538 length:486 start_codon:yes stop_codon:yes gene_type:complete
MDVLSVLFKEIQQGFSEVVGIQHCGSFPRRRDDIRLPAILIDLVELEPGSDPGTGELALIAHFEARILVSEQLPESDLWALVQETMLWLFNHSWSETNMGRARLKQASPDHFSPDYQGHRVWLIEWTQTVRVGENVWNGTDVIPSVISLSGLDTENQELEV